MRDICPPLLKKCTNILTPKSVRIPDDSGLTSTPPKNCPVTFCPDKKWCANLSRAGTKICPATIIIFQQHGTKVPKYELHYIHNAPLTKEITWIVSLHTSHSHQATHTKRSLSPVTNCHPLSPVCFEALQL